MTILIYDVHASEGGALAILNDLYARIRRREDENIRWVFLVSTPQYEDTENITVLRYPWVKKSWLHRLYFDNVTARRAVKKYDPDKIYSLQNTGVPFYKKPQYVYVHLPSILTNYKFRIKRDGLKLWVYQNILSKWMLLSLKKADKIFVQTKWMKRAIAKKADISLDKIAIIRPNISNNTIGDFEDTIGNRRRFFYPAASFAYKNHITILKACVHMQRQGIHDYEVIFTITPFENKLTAELYQFALKYKLPIVFRGNMPRDEVFRMYTQSILLFPSRIESFGLPLLEARMSGTPIIASDYSFSHEILKGYEKAIFFKGTAYKVLGDYMMKEVKEPEGYADSLSN